MIEDKDFWILRSTLALLCLIKYERGGLIFRRKVGDKGDLHCCKTVYLFSSGHEMVRVNRLTQRKLQKSRLV